MLDLRYGKSLPETHYINHNTALAFDIVTKQYLSVSAHIYRPYVFI